MKGTTMNPLLSKKFLAKLIGLIGIPVLVALNKKFDLGLTPPEILGLIAMITVYIAGQSAADAATDGKTSGVAQAGALALAAASVAPAAPAPAPAVTPPVPPQP